MQSCACVSVVSPAVTILALAALDNIKYAWLWRHGRQSPAISKDGARSLK